MTRTLLAAAIALLAATPACAGLTRDRIFQPPNAPLTATGLTGAALIEVQTADGLRLKGINVAPQGDMPVILLFHGNASSADGAARWLQPLLARGYGLIAAEYRGYSANPGSPSEAGLAKDADAFYAAARKAAGNRRLIVIGHSLGGGVAFGLAKRARLDALVTIGTFASIPAVAPAYARPFITDRFDNLAAVPTLHEPLFLIHGTADDTIPPGNANLLHAAAVKAARHGATFVLSGVNHQPDGDLVAKLIDCIDKTLTSGHLPPVPPDPRVKAVPFGLTFAQQAIENAATPDKPN